jgi:hypothetical protein
MNELNYASLEASKKLVDNGVVMETDFVWRLGADGWKLLSRDWVTSMMSNTYETYPAPCFTEVWRELPEGTVCKKQPDSITKCANLLMSDLKVFFNTNPTDALIELKIWLEKEKGK